MIHRFITDDIINEMLEDVMEIKLRSYLKGFSYDD